VCVRELVPDSPAAARFKTLGDAPTRWLITRVNGVAVSTPAAFYKAAKGQASVRLNLIDPNDRSTRELTIP
jgi:serine protease Do